MQEVVKTVRSIKQDYLHPKDRPDGWFIVNRIYEVVLSSIDISQTVRYLLILQYD